MLITVLYFLSQIMYPFHFHHHLWTCLYVIVLLLTINLKQKAFWFNLILISESLRGAPDGTVLRSLTSQRSLSGIFLLFLSPRFIAGLEIYQTPRDLSAPWKFSGDPFTTRYARLFWSSFPIDTGRRNIPSLNIYRAIGFRNIPFSFGIILHRSYCSNLKDRKMEKERESERDSCVSNLPGTFLLLRTRSVILQFFSYRLTRIAFHWKFLSINSFLEKAALLSFWEFRRSVSI